MKKWERSSPAFHMQCMNLETQKKQITEKYYSIVWWIIAVLKLITAEREEWKLKGKQS